VKTNSPHGHLAILLSPHTEHSYRAGNSQLDVAWEAFAATDFKFAQITRARSQNLPQRLLGNFFVIPVGGLYDDDEWLAMFGHQLWIPLGGLVRYKGKTLLGNLELMGDH